MQRIMLKSKIHQATLTGSNLNYEGSIEAEKFEAAVVFVDENNKLRK